MESDRVKKTSEFDFYMQSFCLHAGEKGNLYTWGSGEMGQLGYNSKVIAQMPKDRDGYPFQVSDQIKFLFELPLSNFYNQTFLLTYSRVQPFPLEIEQLREKGVYQIAGGDGHTVAVDIRGNVYSWGASACGQLGLSSMRDLPTDIEGYPYQPTPRIVDLLSNIKIVQIACGDAHTVALTNDGKLFSWGGGGCG